MVLGEAAAGAAASAHYLFGYNRENYMYDRKQRQEFEFKVLEWRRAQAEMWRDDVRDVIGLTDKKMDTYLVVSTLQLGMCVVLFAEGRLEPGTPPWLLHLYMLTLGAAFMYLLMAVWSAMHASVVASCSSVRLLTQFVRLPVPTWEQLEDMRTYAQSMEQLEVSKLLRVPFTNHKASKRSARSSSSVDILAEAVTPESSPNANDTGNATPTNGSAEALPPDPWGLEYHGDERAHEELQHHPLELRRHVELAKRAARQFRCHDAFARVAMSFGTVQFLSAITYYVLGYVAVQDGAPYPACCVAFIFTGAALVLVHLDFTLSAKEQIVARILVAAGPATACFATFAWAFKGRELQEVIDHGGNACSDSSVGVCVCGVIMRMLPVAYASHGLWLFFALITCGCQLQPDGSVLPVRLRSVLYLDVFGWVTQLGGKPQLTEAPRRSPSTPTATRMEASSPRAFALSGRSAASGASARRRGSIEDQGGMTPVVTEACSSAPLLNEAISPASLLPHDKVLGPSGEHAHAPDHAFHASSFHHGHQEDDEGDLVTGHDKVDPGRLPAKVFRISTMVLILLWIFSLSLPFGIFGDFMTKPLTAQIMVEGGGEDDERHEGTEGLGGDAGGEAGDGKVGEHVQPKLLTGGKVIKVGWPTHSGFIPHGLSADPTGTQLVVADDLGVYAGRLSWVVGDGTEAKVPEGGAMEADEGSHETESERRQLLGNTVTYGREASPSLRPVRSKSLPGERVALGVIFKHLPPCAALEGQALADIGVVCHGEQKSEQCNVVVMHDWGRRLALCPLLLHQSAPDSEKAKEQLPISKNHEFAWTISHSWLHLGAKEAVEAFAVNSACLGKDHDDFEAGCAVVGTTQGRVVQLRPALDDRQQLVPERAVQQSGFDVRRGGLHIFSNSLVVALRKNTLEAFSSELGTPVGKWRMPEGIDWRMICGGGESLFALGLRNGMSKLYRFPLPAELKVGPLQDHAEDLRTSLPALVMG